MKKGTVKYGTTKNLMGVELIYDEAVLMKALSNSKEWITTHGRLSAELAREISNKVPVDTGKLKQSILPLHPTQDIDMFQYTGQKPPAIAGVSIGSSTTKGKDADLAPYWAFVEYGTGFVGQATEVSKPIGNPDNWQYGAITGQRAKAYIRRGIKSFLTKLRTGHIKGF